jgi:hypothetical protein
MWPVSGDSTRWLKPVERKGFSKTVGPGDSAESSPKFSRHAPAAQLTRLLPSCRMTSGGLCRSFGLVDFVVSEHSPDDPRILVGERNRNDIGMPPLPRLAEPEASWVLFAIGLTECGARAMDQEGTQITIAALADAE